MKKSVLFIMMLLTISLTASAQKFALIDMEYILKNIPSYEMANEQLKQVSQRWEKEITTQAQKVESMYMDSINCKNSMSKILFYTTGDLATKHLTGGIKRIGMWYFLLGQILLNCKN